jgi:hypothetical protein
MEPDLAFALLALDADLLASFTDADLIAITSNMTPKQKRRFFIEKNIKILGGINAYIDDIADNTNINLLTSREIIGLVKLLLEVMKYPNISDANKLEIKLMINEALVRKTETAPAAGGKRRRRQTRRTRRRK